MVHPSVGLSGNEHSTFRVVGAAMRLHLFGGALAYSARHGTRRVGGGDRRERGTGVGC